MFQLKQTEIFGKWLSDLRDTRAKARILARLESARLGNLGDTRSVGDGVSELRIELAQAIACFTPRFVDPARVEFALRPTSALMRFARSLPG